MTYGFTLQTRKDDAFLMKVLIIDESKNPTHYEFDDVIYRVESGILDDRISEFLSEADLKVCSRCCKERLINLGHLEGVS